MMYWISRGIFEAFVRLLLKVRIFGKNVLPKPPFIIVSNHSSNVDPPLVGMACTKYPIHFMTKKELFDAPILGIWTRSVGCIEVERTKASTKGLKEAIRYLKKGHVVGSFPEGTRSMDGELQQAKLGTGFLVAKAKVPVVPVYISGSREAWPKGGKVKRGARVDIIVGEPIMPDEFDAGGKKGKESYEAISELIMKKILDLKKRVRPGS